MNKYDEIPRHTLTRNVKARKKKNYETLLKDLKNKFLRGSLNIAKMRRKLPIHFFKSRHYNDYAHTQWIARLDK